MAQTLKFGNKTWATKEGSTLAYNDENGNYKPLPFAFTRSTSATRVNKEGLIEVVKSNVPRIDYTDTSDGVLLLENAATNFALYSEDFSQWIASNLSTVGGFTSPDGNNNAYKLIADNSSTVHKIRTNLTSQAAGWSYSLYAKADEYDRIIIWGNNTNFVGFNLTNGTIESSLGLFVTSATIDDVGNGWYRIRISSSSTGSGGNINISVYNEKYLDGNSNPTFIGDNVSGVLVWGAMLESGDLSSYIPTQGSAVTRVAETANNSGNSEVFNDSEGVLFADISALEETNSFEAISINDNSTSDRIFMGYYSDDLYVTVVDGSQAKYDVNTPINVKQNNKIAVKYKAQDFSFYLNGFEIDASVGINGGTTPSGLSQLSFNRGDGVEPFYGKTKEIGYYDAILTDLELEYLTSYRSWESMVNELNLNIIYNG